jgi:hypothetical protein
MPVIADDDVDPGIIPEPAAGPRPVLATLRLVFCPGLIPGKKACGVFRS